MDGAAFLRQLKEAPELAETPVVVMSGNRDTATTATTLGADGYLLKPIEIDDLTHLVARFVPFDVAAT
jgi:CheY-like chemotaxis protein